MQPLLAGLPVVILLALLLSGRASAAKAAWAALAATLVVALAFFGFPHAVGTGRNLSGVAAEGVFLAFTILWILLPAMAIYEVQTSTGSLQVLRHAIAGATPGHSSRMLLIGWFLVMFLEGSAGFGAPLAIAAPMLVAMGLGPAAAVATAVVGHVVGVTFGAVGTPVLAQAGLTQAAAAADISRYTALLVVPVIWMPALFVLWEARAKCEKFGDIPWREGVLAAALFGMPYAIFAVVLGPELPTLGGALAGVVVFVAWLRRRGGGGPDGSGRRPAGLLRAAAPYLVLIALIVLTRLIGPLKAVVTAPVLDWELHEVYRGSFLPLYHPGTLLLCSLVVGGLMQGAGMGGVAKALAKAGRQLLPAAIALVAMLTLSRLMLHAGMVAELAGAAEECVGRLWPGVAPAIGALGSFVTGSATASNILFTNLQEGAALNLGLSVVLVLAAQTVGAALGNAICPHNIIAGCAAVGITGREGEIMRRTFPITILLLMIVGAIALALA